MIRLLAPLFFSLLLLTAPAAWATDSTAHYRCDGDHLVATFHNGAVDAREIPNSGGGTVPGAFVVLQWRGISLQLPRSNNAGTPSYTDGRWWWQAIDPEHPDFREIRGSSRSFDCQSQPQPA